MSEMHRYYKCGCCPDEEQFCKRAEKLVHKEQIATMARFDECTTREEAASQAWKEGYCRGWMNCHIGTQYLAGDYTDVPYPSEPSEADDEWGYDEDPKIVGYPS